MKIHKDQINDYKDQGFEFKKQSTKLFNGQKWTIVTYEKHFKIKEKPKLVFETIKHIFSFKGSEILEDLRAIFTGKKKVIVENPPRVPLDSKLLKNLVDKKVLGQVMQMKAYVNEAASITEERLTEEEAQLLGSLGEEKLEMLDAFLEDNLLEMFSKQFEDQLEEHKQKQWDSYEDDFVRVAYTPVGNEPKYTVELNAKDNGNSVILDGEEYNIPGDLLKRIVHGYFSQMLAELAETKEVGDLIGPSKEPLKVFLVELAEF